MPKILIYSRLPPPTPLFMISLSEILFTHGQSWSENIK